MQGWYAERFEREMGYTEAEWLAVLDAACSPHTVRRDDGGGARVDIDNGRLALRWQVMPPRQIALMRMPRLAVSFDFDGVDESRRQVFMRRFDLHVQRGGG